jgi:hypothetical protein
MGINNKPVSAHWLLPPFQIKPVPVVNLVSSFHENVFPRKRERKRVSTKMVPVPLRVQSYSCTIYLCRREVLNLDSTLVQLYSSTHVYVLQYTESCSNTRVYCLVEQKGTAEVLLLLVLGEIIET